MPIETFKGIEFVRISSMSKDQQDKIWESFQHDKIIKIVRDQSLMNDCILYHDFTTWQASQPAPLPPTSIQQAPTTIGKLVFE